MKTEAIPVTPDVTSYIHSLPLISHIEGAGHLSFINRIPLRLRRMPSVLNFVVQDTLMVCYQAPSPDGVPLLIALQRVKEVAEQRAELTHHYMTMTGQYVGLAVVFPMTLVPFEGNPEDVTLGDIRRLKAEGKATSRPGLLATHDGTVLEAQWKRNAGGYRPLGVQTHSGDGTRQALLDAHAALCHAVDTPPRSRGRRLRDMYEDD